MYCLTKQELKDSLAGILKGFKPVSIWGPLLIGALWIIVLVKLLWWINLWDWGSLKTTVVWSLTFAFYSMFQVINIEFNQKYRKQLTLESFGLAAILMFIGSVYTLPLWGEFVIFPFVSLLTMVQVFSSYKAELRNAEKLASKILTLIGLGYISYWGYSMYQNPNLLFTWNNFIDFFMPIILTIWYLPYLFLWKLVMVYELLFLSLKRKIDDSKLLRFSKVMAIWSLNWNVKAIDQFKTRVAARPLDNKYDIVKQLNWVKLQRLKKKYHTEDSPLGWAPNNAMLFLSKIDMEIKSYSEPFDGEWYGSVFKKLKSDYLFSTFKYSIEGTDTHVKLLKVVMSVWSPDNILEAQVEFYKAAVKLMKVASKALPFRFTEQLDKFEPFEGKINHILYKLEIAEWNSSDHEIVDYKLTLSCT